MVGITVTWAAIFFLGGGLFAFAITYSIMSKQAILKEQESIENIKILNEKSKLLQVYIEKIKQSLKEK